MLQQCIGDVITCVTQRRSSTLQIESGRAIKKNPLKATALIVLTLTSPSGGRRDNYDVLQQTISDTSCCRLTYLLILVVGLRSTDDFAVDNSSSFRRLFLDLSRPGLRFLFKDKEVIIIIMVITTQCWYWAR